MNDRVRKVSEMLGFELIGKEWNEYSTENEKLKGQVVLRFSCMGELAGRVIPKIISWPFVADVVPDKEGKPTDFRFVMVNQAYEKYVGIKASEVIGKTLLEVYP